MENRTKIYLAGLCSQLVCIGVARFAYTPLLPVMQSQAELGVAAGGWLATIIYAGYLAGALIASVVSDLAFKDRLYRFGLIAAILSTVGMGLTDNLYIWGILRFIAGASGAASLLIGSALILNWLARHGHRKELGPHFMGIGLGVALAAAAVEIMLRLDVGWQDQWLWLTGVALLLTVPAWVWMPKPSQSGPANTGEHLKDQPPCKSFLALMIPAYFCAGYAYVISATFISAMVESSQGLDGFGSLVFLIVGLAATPAVLFWDRLARRTGYIPALIIAYVGQGAGIALPALWDSLSIALLAAALFGATFVGCVGLVLTMAGLFYPSKPAKLMGRLTLSFGVAQILAPALTGVMAEAGDGYAMGFWISAGFSFLGALMLGAILLKVGTPQALRIKDA